jgi:hypothetical protein
MPEPRNSNNTAVSGAKAEICTKKEISGKKVKGI